MLVWLVVQAQNSVGVNMLAGGTWLQYKEGKMTNGHVHPQKASNPVPHLR